MHHAHVIIIHFPIALFITSGFLSLIGLFYRRGLFVEILFWQLIIGVLLALASIYTGLQEEVQMAVTNEMADLMAIHKRNGYIMTGFFFVLTLWLALRKKNMKIREYASWMIFVVFGSFIVIYQALLGTQLMYPEGARINKTEKIYPAEIQAPQQDLSSF